MAFFKGALVLGLIFGPWEISTFPLRVPQNRLGVRGFWSATTDEPSLVNDAPEPPPQAGNPSRRHCLHSASTALALAFLGPVRSNAEEGDAPPAPAPILVTYKDPVGLFSVDLPKNWYKIRPTDKGDLPDETGKGRRGSRIFSSGDISNSFAPKILAIERFPAAVLLPDETTKTISSWDAIGSPDRVAKLLIQLRDRESVSKGQQAETRLMKGSVECDGTRLTFLAEIEIPVMRPDLLQKESGMLSINRIVLCHAELRQDESVAGPIPDKTLGGRPIVTALWVSSEQRDWTDDKDAGIAKAVSNSFAVS